MAVTLQTYEQDTQRLLKDPNATYYPLADVDNYINRARFQVAMESQCLRFLISGVISSVTVNSGGTGYSASTSVTASGSGMGAVLVPALSGGSITSVTVIGGGTSWDNTTTLTVTDGAGTGASLTAVQVGTNVTTTGLEIYPFTTINTALTSLQPGASQILGVLGIAVSWGSMKPSLKRVTWTEFQAMYRAWTTGYIGQPAVYAQYGQGVNAAIYLCPMPSSTLNMDWDVFCAPISLTTYSSLEIIPFPWTQSVAYYAAYLAYANSQRAEDSANMLNIYEKMMRRNEAMIDQTFISDPYA